MCCLLGCRRRRLRGGPGWRGQRRTHGPRRERRAETTTHTRPLFWYGGRRRGLAGLPFRRSLVRQLRSRGDGSGFRRSSEFCGLFFRHMRASFCRRSAVRRLASRSRRRFLAQENVAQLSSHVFVNRAGVRFAGYSELLQLVKDRMRFDLKVSRELIDPTRFVHNCLRSWKPEIARYFRFAPGIIDLDP